MEGVQKWKHKDSLMKLLKPSRWVIGLACICIIAGRWEEVAMLEHVVNTEFMTLADGLDEGCREKRGLSDELYSFDFFISVTGDTVVERSLSMV